jgi:type I restriction enzyme M protein
VIDKENAQNRKGLFMIDASKGVMKDGNKNRLRSMDIHKIVDVFNNQIEWPKYSRIVPFIDIEKNEFNLNIPRYIDSQESEDIQDIEAHLLGGIPQADIDALEAYWKVYPSLKSTLFSKGDRKNYLHLRILKESIRQIIFSHPEFEKYATELDHVFAGWKKKSRGMLKALKVNHHPKKIIYELSEDMLERYSGRALIDNYDMYQLLMDYWAEVMQDDCYIIADDGWKANTYRILEKNNKGKEIDRGWTCDLVPKQLVIDRFFKKEKEALAELQSEQDRIVSELAELEDEHSADEGFFADMEKVTKAAVQKRLKELEKTTIKELLVAAEPAAKYGQSGESSEELEHQVLTKYLDLSDRQSSIRKEIKEAEAMLDEHLLDKYKKLTEDEIKTIVVDDKWLGSVEKNVRSDMNRISYRLTHRINDLAERYETRLSQFERSIEQAESKVNTHLEKMGFTWRL